MFALRHENWINLEIWEVHKSRKSEAQEGQFSRSLNFDLGFQKFLSYNTWHMVFPVLSIKSQNGTRNICWDLQLHVVRESCKLICIYKKWILRQHRMQIEDNAKTTRVPVQTSAPARCCVPLYSVYLKLRDKQ